MGSHSGVIEIILHCQKQIKRKPSKERLLHYLGRLSRLRIEAADLQNTTIGRTVNHLTRKQGRVGREAKELVNRWKDLVIKEWYPSVKQEDESEKDDDGEENDSYSSPQQTYGEEEDEIKQEHNETDNEDDLEEQALPSVINYSRNQNESDNESDSSDRLCIDDDETSRVDFAQNNQEIPSDDEENEEKEVNDVKFFPSGSSCDESEETGNETDQSNKRRSPSPFQQLKSTSNLNKKITNSPVLIKREKRSRSRSESPPCRKSSSKKHKGTKKSGIADAGSSEHMTKSPKNGILIKKEKDDLSYNSVNTKRKHNEVENNLDEEDGKDGKRIKTEKSKKHTDAILKPKLLPRMSVEIDSSSGFNFSDVLSGLDSKKLTTNSKPKNSSKKHLSSPSNGDKSAIGISTTRKTEEAESRVEAKFSKPSYAPPISTITCIIGNESKHVNSNDVKPEALKGSSKNSCSLISTTASEQGSSRSVQPLYPPLKTVTTEQSRILRDLADESHWENGIYGKLDHKQNLYSSARNECEEDALSSMISSRNKRTKVFSGVKNQGKFRGAGKVDRLYDLCLRVVGENIECLNYTGGVPYDILEPILKKATLKQLEHVEFYNPYLIESTDDLWKYHCNQNFRGRRPEELESWRDLYYRLVVERDSRLKSLTNEMRRKLDDQTPVRKAKLAYVETTRGPKFNKSKAATIKTGMSSLKLRDEKTIGRNHGSSASSGGSSLSQQNIILEPASVIIPGSKSRGNLINACAGTSREGNASTVQASSSSLNKKPRKAPLMQKTLKSMKTLMRR